MIGVPQQSPPVFRDPFARDRPDEPDDDHGVPGGPAKSGVEASQTRCDHLVGPAQSMCYAALYGVSV
jgi:hypothetical protein